jgi:hypothetical protein
MSQQAINYITSFLSNRTKTVILENITSEKIPVTPGVPQGTLASPVPTESLLRNLLEALDNQIVYVWACRLYCHLQIGLFGCF